MPAKKLLFEEDAPRPRIETIATAEIRADQLVQSRVRLDPHVIAEYSDLMTSGVEFPPVAVVQVDDAYLLVDGFLRFEAAKIANQKTMACEVRRGDLRKALLLSTKANAQHGLRRTHEDKRRAVGKLLNDAEWSQWSDREIARLCSVSHVFVGNLRAQLFTGNVTSERQFRSKHDTVTTMNTSAIGGRKTLDLPPITLTAPSPASETSSDEVLLLTAPTSSIETSGEVLSLSDFAQDRREQFVAGLKEAEKIFDAMPAVTVIRGDPAADAVLAKRLTWLADKAADKARMLLRPDV